MNKTIENLGKAFVGESQARNRYTLYSKAAKAEGYEQVAGIFLLTLEPKDQLKSTEIHYFVVLRKL